MRQWKPTLKYSENVRGKGVSNAVYTYCEGNLNLLILNAVESRFNDYPNSKI